MAGGDKCIGVYEAAGAGVIVAGLEVIEAGFGVVDIAAVAQGVGFAEGCRHGAGGISNIAPGIVGIFHHDSAAAVHDGKNIALEVGYIEIRGSVSTGRRSHCWNIRPLVSHCFTNNDLQSYTDQLILRKMVFLARSCPYLMQFH